MSTAKTIAKTAKLYRRVLTEAVTVEHHHRDDGYAATKGNPADFNAFFREKIGTNYMKMYKVTDCGNGQYHVSSSTGWTVVTL